MTVDFPLLRWNPCAAICSKSAPPARSAFRFRFPRSSSGGGGGPERGVSRSSALRDVSLLIIYLQGGMSTIDVFDLKPEAPPNFAAISGRSTRAPPGCKSASICRARPAGRQILALALFHA